MSITKNSTYSYDLIGDYSVQVKRHDSFTEDGKEISTSNHRYVIHPNMDWSSETDEIKKVCDGLFTAKVKKEYLADKKKRMPGWVEQDKSIGTGEGLALHDPSK